MAETITLNDGYGYTQSKFSAINSTLIDATGASWIVSNMGGDLNLYPILISGSAGVTLVGGTITGEVPQDIDRVDAYVNSAGIFLRDSAGAVVRDWTISEAWDGIRVRGSNNFVIDSVWMRDIRDDAIEN